MQENLTWYENDKAGAKQYIKRSKIKYIGWFRNFYDRFCVWEMTPYRNRNIGLPVGEFTNKEDAIIFADRLAKIGNLKVKEVD